MDFTMKEKLLVFVTIITCYHSYDYHYYNVSSNYIYSSINKNIIIGKTENIIENLIISCTITVSYIIS